MKLIVILFLSFLCTQTHAQTLKQFTFQGKLSDVNENFTGTKTIEYTVYDLNDILWRENHENVAVKNGNYEVKLGSITSFPSTLFKTDVIERTVVIKVEAITQGFFRLPDFTQNNSVFNGKTLTVDFGKYGKEIDFDKIKVEENYQLYAPLGVAFEYKNVLPENDESGLYYIYEKLMAKLSNSSINLNDEELMIAYINCFVNKTSQKLVFDTVRSEKEKQSLLKVAVLTLDWEFMENAINLYSYPLNEIGQVDKMTLLDLIYEDINYYKKGAVPNETLDNLKKYYKLFKSKGARHHKYPATTTID
ncbi:hypothetical protein [Polaribacter sp.]|uniref:hypothetical protein n=1 Tax=Polaribacter sp. TaxID=1920175 RepID=UPI004047120F